MLSTVLQSKCYLGSVCLVDNFLTPMGVIINTE